jgi:hypothetical protein
MTKNNALEQFKKEVSLILKIAKRENRKMDWILLKHELYNFWCEAVNLFRRKKVLKKNRKAMSLIAQWEAQPLTDEEEKIYDEIESSKF